MGNQDRQDRVFEVLDVATKPAQFAIGMVKMFFIIIILFAVAIGTPIYVYFTGGTVTPLQLELAGTVILFIFTFLVAPWYTVLGGIVAFIGFMCLICVPSFQATIPVGDAFFSYVLGWIFWFCVIGILQWLFRKMNRPPKTESQKIEEFAHQLEGRGMSALEIAKLYSRKMAVETETESERAEWAADVASWARIEPEAKTAVKAAAEAGTAARVSNRQLTITPASDDTMDAAIAELIAEARACDCQECEDAYHLLEVEKGVRNTAAGLRYVLYLFLTELERPWVVTHKPAGYFIAPEGGERVGDVSNVVFSNGWIEGKNGEVFVYYASSDTRMHVATSTVDKLLDYVLNTPADPLRSHACVVQRNAMIEKNLEELKTLKLQRAK
jgi:hypothetical protein